MRSPGTHLLYIIIICEGMSTEGRRPIARRATHGAVSLTAGFLTGIALFVVIGAALNDAVFSALVLAIVVAVSRVLTTR